MVQGKIWMYEGSYQRETADAKNVPTIFSLTFIANPALFPSQFKSEVIILADTKTFKVKATEPDEAYGSSRQTMLYGGGSSPYVIHHSRSSFKTIKLQIPWTVEIEKAVAAASSISYRFYAGTEPLTLTVTPKQLEAIRQFLAAAALAPRAGQ